MTGNVKLCCMVLPRLGFVLPGREFQCLSCPVVFGKTVIYVYCQVACYLVPLVFAVRDVCPVVKYLICLSELSLILMSHQSEQSACGCSFFPPVSRIPWLNSLEFMLTTGALGEI